ncbi:MAG: phosphotransferase family protein [Micavibrio sp.]|nr:phosphotransferase family protein [Micavibrio sp.]
MTTVSNDPMLVHVRAGAPVIPFPPTASLRHEAEAFPLDWGRIAGHLALQGFFVDKSVPPRQFSGGLANLNYLLRVNDDWMVLRRPPSGPLPPGANDMRREHRILSQLGKVLPLAPRSHMLCEDVSIAGAPFQLLEFREGLAIRGDVVDPLPDTPETGRALSAMLIDTLATVHDVDVNAIGLGQLGRPEGFFARTAKGWADRGLLICDGAMSPAAQAVADWLSAVPTMAEGKPVLLHNDFKLDNILVEADTLTPLAIFDWDMSTRGDPLFDLATLLSYWTEPEDPDCMRRLAQMPTAQPGFYSREQVAVAYADATGRSIVDLKPFRVLTMFKLGVVFHQLHRRALTGDAVDSRYATFGTLAEELFEFTLDIVADKVF